MAERPPVHPYLVLALAIAFPGMGHVALGQSFRGLGFAFFSLLLALITYRISSPDVSFVGRSAAGLFVWALSIPDAYRTARLRYQLWLRRART